MADHTQAQHAPPAATDGPSRAAAPGPWRLALTATMHCLTGCTIGELAGMMIGMALALSNGVTIALATVLAFLFGYAFTLRPLIRTLPFRAALGVALASDTFSIAVMELVDNGVMLLIPGAMHATLGQPLFWWSMAASLLLGGLAAWPLNRWLIGRGLGHTRAHAAHAGHHH